ncbi:MAG: glutamate--tRNA ligase, partial [Gemmatimonadetes bacterium]|nr:glutamate--tRNA ligase [Gemmatimonadota bacterium]
ARDAALADPANRAVLDAVRGRLAALPEWTEEGINAAVREGGRDAGARGKALFVPVRLALTGEEHGVELPRVARVLGRERTLALLAPDGAG